MKYCLCWLRLSISRENGTKKRRWAQEISPKKREAKQHHTHQLDYWARGKSRRVHQTCREPRAYSTANILCHQFAFAIVRRECCRSLGGKRKQQTSIADRDLPRAKNNQIIKYIQHPSPYTSRTEHSCYFDCNTKTKTTSKTRKTVRRLSALPQERNCQRPSADRYSLCTPAKKECHPRLAIHVSRAVAQTNNHLSLGARRPAASIMPLRLPKKRISQGNQADADGNPDEKPAVDPLARRHAGFYIGIGMGCRHNMQEKIRLARYLYRMQKYRRVGRYRCTVVF